MTQAWVVMGLDEWVVEVPLAVFATHEEADAFVRLNPRTALEIVGPVPVGLAAMVAP